MEKTHFSLEIHPLEEGGVPKQTLVKYAEDGETRLYGFVIRPKLSEISKLILSEIRRRGIKQNPTTFEQTQAEYHGKYER